MLIQIAVYKNGVLMANIPYNAAFASILWNTCLPRACKTSILAFVNKKTAERRYAEYTWEWKP